MRAALFPALLLTAMPLASSAQRTADYAPDSWVLRGPFENRQVEGRRAGLHSAAFDESSLAPFPGKTVKGRSVDLAAHFAPSDNKVAYARGVVKVARETKLEALFGSDDGAKIWLNGELVHQIEGDRGLTPEQDRFPVRLKAGENVFLVKVENGAGGWGFELSIPTEAELKRRREAAFRRDLGVKEMVAERHGGFGRVLMGPAFPQIVFQDSFLLEPYLKSPFPKVTWYSQEGQEVKSATTPGLYFAWAEAETKEGIPFQQLLTFILPRPEMGILMSEEVGPGILLTLAEQPPHPALAANWKSARESISAMTQGLATDRLYTSEAGPYALLAAFGQEPAFPGPQGWAATVSGYQLRAKMKALGRTPKKVAEPQQAVELSPELRLGTEAEAGMKPGTADRVRALLAEWSREEGKPFTAVIARKGVAFVHEGYGVEKDASFYPASIGKTLFGLVFAQFVDQGLVDPDQPVGSVLPGYPTTGPAALTFRNCVTHTSGIADHGTYGGWLNPTLESAFRLRANDLKPGERFAYGGDGNNLAAKGLELISGRPISELMERQLFTPLGAKITQPDGGWSSQATAWDIAKVGQMMANRGRYGDKVFLSEEGFRKFLPTKLKPFMPKLQDPALEWGFAVSYMPDPDGPREKGALGPNVIGHGSASSSILRVDLDSGLVVVMGRYGVGKAEKYNEYRVKLMEALKQGLSR